MKRILFAGLLSFALARLAAGQGLTGYTNVQNLYGDYPPVIDATNFVNLGVFDFTPGDTQPYQFSDVLTYTNRNLSVL